MVPPVHDIATLLQRPALQALPAPLRHALAEAAAQDGADAGMPDPVGVAADTLDTLAALSADGDVMLAALLYAVPALQSAVRSGTGMSAALADLREGQAAAAQVWALHAEQERSVNTEGLRRLLLAIVRDLRVVTILLARQLARMRAAGALPEPERQALARLTRDIHAPLANRLGIWQLKWELEDLAFRYLQPQVYKQIATQLDEKRTGRERYIAAVIASLQKALAEHGIRAEISGRPKHIYSIWRKMQRKQVGFDELYDLRAVRIAVDDVAACYAALGVVHALWVPIPSEFDDYIARPKANDYRSLHTAVVGPEGRTLEVQIRTHEMHAQAELGVAAHWKYKEGKGGGDAFDRKIAWMRRLLEGSGESTGEGTLAGDLDAELVEDRVYALTPKGEVVDLPRGGTVLDFAYHVHTMVGHRTRGAKVNGRIVPLNHVLRSGDRVEILTSKEPEPRRDWLLPANGFPRQRALARQGAGVVPQAGPHAQPAGRARTAGEGTQAAGPAPGRPGRRGEEIPRRQRRRSLHPGGAGRCRAAPGRARTARRAAGSSRTRRSCAARAASATQGRGTRQVEVHRAGRGQPAGAAGALLPAGTR